MRAPMLLGVLLLSCAQEPDPALLDQIAQLEARVTTLEEAERAAAAPTPAPAPTPTPSPDTLLGAESSQHMAVDLGSFEGMLAALERAKRDEDAATVRRLDRQLARQGSNHIGNLMLRGNCPGAQRAYQQLAAVGAEAHSSQHFSADWCPLPN